MWSKGPNAQRNEVLCKVLAHNLCVLVQAFFEPGVEPRFWDNGTSALSEPYTPTRTPNLPDRTPWTGLRKKGRKPCHVNPPEAPLPLFGS